MINFDATKIGDYTLPYKYLVEYILLINLY
uniref:Uncharacterized protein n=1 Tax=Siphoviridae sp. ct3fB6 TaxID=2827770 RepID=A0A8S5T892_9CAUD|nr:MAG TPA: hypothetical protein [Siphoviridae sp. ct3fB6]